MPDFGKIAKNVKMIIVSDNNIASCGELCTAKFPHLQTIEVGDNLLQSFPLDEVKANSPMVQQLSLDGNPLRTVSDDPEWCPQYSDG